MPTSINGFNAESFYGSPFAKAEDDAMQALRDAISAAYQRGREDEKLNWRETAILNRIASARNNERVKVLAETSESIKNAEEHVRDVLNQERIADIGNAIQTGRSEIICFVHEKFLEAGVDTADEWLYEKLETEIRERFQ